MILIVDDHNEVINWMRAAIQDEGYYCDVASDATSAFYKVQRLNYALALIDIGLPDYSGVTLAKLISNLPNERGSLPMVAMSGGEVKEDLSLFKCVLTKPFSAKVIHDAIIQYARPPIKDLHISRSIMMSVNS